MSKGPSITHPGDLSSHFFQSLQTEELGGYALKESRPAKGERALSFEVQDQKATLAVRPILHPSRRLLDETHGTQGGDQLILCAHLPESLAADLRRKGICHADLNGRIFIQTPWFLLDRRPLDQRFRNPDSQRDIFALKTSRLARTLLVHREKAWTQEELTQRTGLSRGLVSQILRQLLDDEIVVRTSAHTRSAPAGFALANFERLLNQWQGADQWPKRARVHQYSLLSSDVDKTARKVAEILGGRTEDRSPDGETQVAFTQWYAAHLRHPYTTPPLVSAYVRSERLLELPLGRQVDSGGNVWLILPEDDGVFQETQDVRGLVLACDVQIYLDLLQVSQRGPEQAEALRAWDGFGR